MRKWAPPIPPFYTLPTVTSGNKIIYLLNLMDKIEMGMNTKVGGILTAMITKIYEKRSWFSSSIQWRNRWRSFSHQILGWPSTWALDLLRELSNAAYLCAVWWRYIPTCSRCKNLPTTSTNALPLLDEQCLPWQRQLKYIAHALKHSFSHELVVVKFVYIKQWHFLLT